MQDSGRHLVKCSIQLFSTITHPRSINVRPGRSEAIKIAGQDSRLSELESGKYPYRLSTHNKAVRAKREYSRQQAASR